MPSLAAIRQRRRSDRLDALRRGAAGAVADHPGGEVWLYSCGEAFGYGSLARGDWDACSDVDLLAVAPTRGAAEALADALLTAQLGDDVLALSHEQWQRLRAGDDPYWRAIGRDALRLDRP